MIRAIFNILGYALKFIITAFIIAILFTKIYGMISGHNDRGVFVYNVYTDSMNHGNRFKSYRNGGFSSGDAIIVASKKPLVTKGNDVYYGIKPGDVISYYPDINNKNVILTHRLVDIVQDENTGDYIFYTQGDANNAQDTGITQDQIIGRYIAPIPFFGHFMSFIDKVTPNFGILN